MKVTIDKLQESIKTDDESQKLFTEFKSELNKNSMKLKLLLLAIAFIGFFFIFYDYKIKTDRDELRIKLENCEKK